MKKIAVTPDDIRAAAKSVDGINELASEMAERHLKEFNKIVNSIVVGHPFVSKIPFFTAYLKAMSAGVAASIVHAFDKNKQELIDMPGSPVATEAKYKSLMDTYLSNVVASMINALSIVKERKPFPSMETISDLTTILLKECDFPEMLDHFVSNKEVALQTHKEMNEEEEKKEREEEELRASIVENAKMRAKGDKHN